MLICCYHFYSDIFGSTLAIFEPSWDLSSIANASAVFAFGFVQDLTVQYVGPTGTLQKRHPYLVMEYCTSGDLVSILVYSSFFRQMAAPQIDRFVGDFENAWNCMLQLESNIDAAAGGLKDDYLILLCFATRLAYAPTVLVVGEFPGGTVDATDVMIFMKYMGSYISPCVQTKYLPQSDTMLNVTKQ